MGTAVTACQQSGVVEKPGLAEKESPTLCADLDRPDKQETIAQYRIHSFKMSLREIQLKLCVKLININVTHDTSMQ